MTGQKPGSTGRAPAATAAEWWADVRVEVYLEAGALQSTRTLEVALSAEGVGFAAPPAAGDSFVPGALGKALLAANARPEVARVEHAPALPFHDDAGRPGYACVIVTCSMPVPPIDELVAEWRAEGWAVYDFRHQNELQRSSDR